MGLLIKGEYFLRVFLNETTQYGITVATIQQSVLIFLSEGPIYFKDCSRHLSFQCHLQFLAHTEFTEYLILN